MENASSTVRNCVEATEKSVILKDGRKISVRSMRPDDVQRSYEFFCALPAEDRKYLRTDVTRRKLVERRTTEHDGDRVIRIVAVDDGEITAGIDQGCAHAQSRACEAVTCAVN